MWPTTNSFVSLYRIVISPKLSDVLDTASPNTLFPLAIDEFIEENKELIVRWSVFLHSCLLYLIYTTIDLNDVIKVEEKFEHIDDPDYIGLNACQLFAVEDFYISFIAGTIPEKLYFFTRQFTESIFRGSKLIKYFEVNENHFYAILQGLIINEIPLSIISEDEFVVKDK